MRLGCRYEHKYTGIPPNKHAVCSCGAALGISEADMFVYYLYFFIPAHKRTFVAVRMRTPEEDPPPGVRAALTPPIMCRKSQRADPHSRAVIDEDPQSPGSRGKDQFVYSALSPGSLWQFDLCHADVRHRFLIWSLARLTQAALLLSSQCILMKRKGGGGGGTWLQI